MADDSQAQALAQPSEEIHLPDPSYMPVLLAFGITVAVIGVVLTWVMVAIGLIIALVALTRWIRQTREEMAELPLEH
ncbi:MAG TPA: cytochrome c oxidase subunit 4 [Thermoleophilaceae bacterium]